MQVKTYLLLLPWLLIGQLWAQDMPVTPAHDHNPIELRLGLAACIGAHRVVGELQKTHYGETATWSFVTHPAINPIGLFGLNLHIGKAGQRLAGLLTVGLGMQYHHFSYDWTGFSRHYGPFEGTQKVAEHVLLSDFALRAKWTGRQPKPWAIAVGGFAGVRLLSRSRSYVKLDRGNIIQPHWLGAPAGALVQVSRRLGGKRCTWEPFVEARMGLGAIMVVPDQLTSASMSVGANLWWAH